MRSFVNSAVLFAIVLLVPACVHRNDTRDETMKMQVMKAQAVFLDKTSSDEQLREVFQGLQELPALEDPRLWVRVVNDESSSELARRLAFLAFARRFITPHCDLAELARTYEIGDWFCGDSLLDWSYSSATPLDTEVRTPGSTAGVYAVGAPEGAQPARRGVYFCFALARRIDKDEIRQRIHSRGRGTLVVTHVFVPSPDVWWLE